MQNKEVREKKEEGEDSALLWLFFPSLIFIFILIAWIQILSFYFIGSFSTFLTLGLKIFPPF
jgi:hypothetical protein